MKYMEIPELASLSRSLHHHSSECTVHTRIEAYSCKSINKEKKLFASLEHSYLEDIAAPRSLPPNASPQDDLTPFGHLAHPTARKTLYLLIATLNVAFPDHSFSTLRPDSFVREPSGAHILNALSTTLISLRAPPNSLGVSPPRSYASYPPPPDPEPSASSSSPFFPSSVPTSSSPPNPFANTDTAPPPIMSGTHPTLYKLLDDVIKLAECEVFSYSPEINSDPHAGDSDDDEPESDEEPEFSDDEYDFDDLAYQSEPDDDYTFSFDEEYEPKPVSISPPKSRWMQDPPRKRTNSSDDSAFEPPERSRPRHIPSLRLRRTRTPLLWSSHWFFYNKKLKRILFVSVWARKKSWPVSTSALEEFSGYQLPSSGETFRGWAGDVGAGARALGLAKSL
ncbi:Maf1 regulator-domain-containing protein [Gautieria morchelliformis]|nr:Maf1 regulator-domain-containing protein [Gautieria morchelliformis]